MIHTNLPRNCTVFLLLCELTRSAIFGSQQFDSHKWPTVLVDEVKGKPCNFEACLCGSLYFTFTKSFYPYAFYNKRLQTLFKDQLDRSKATCPFKINNSFHQNAQVYIFGVCGILTPCVYLARQSLLFRELFCYLFYIKKKTELSGFPRDFSVLKRTILPITGNRLGLD